MGGKSTPTPPEPPDPEPTPTPEQVSEPVTEAVRTEEERRLRQFTGAGGTILTSPLGVAGQDDDTLLG